MSFFRNLAWIAVAAALVGLVVVSRETGYARAALSSFDHTSPNEPTG